MVDEHKIMYPCFMCGRSFQMGPHRYDGKYIARYKISVCSGCWGSNWDGWGPHQEMLLVAHIRAEGIDMPDRNEKGWLPRD
jgi:hypothetical protein